MTEQGQTEDGWLEIIMDETPDLGPAIGRPSKHLLAGNQSLNILTFSVEQQQQQRPPAHIFSWSEGRESPDSRVKYEDRAGVMFV